MSRDRHAQQQRRRRRQLTVGRRQYRHSHRTVSCQLVATDVLTRPEMSAVEFGFTDPTPGGGRVCDSLFAEMSHEQRVVIRECVGVPGARWDRLITAGLLAGQLDDSESIIYLLPTSLLEQEVAE
jgi:hypothetical protein